MTKLRSRQGFSLIELLTVIAIIAILAAIIFPVMNSVKQRANEAKCMTNMMQIAKAIKMYKLDNRKFPEMLAHPYVAGTPFDRWISVPTDGCVMGEYVKAAEGFRCPNSKNTNYDNPVGGAGATGQIKDPFNVDTTIGYYAADDYDMYSPTGADGVVRYTTKWATRDSSGNYILGNNLRPDPIVSAPSGDDTPELKAEDYKRQLQWRDPPEDTVVTWCSNHGGGKAVVLFLSGTVRKIDADAVQQCKWRIRPPRS